MDLTEDANIGQLPLGRTELTGLATSSGKAFLTCQQNCGEQERLPTKGYQERVAGKGLPGKGYLAHMILLSLQNTELVMGCSKLM